MGRVLKSGGTAYIMLYNKWSPKVMIANAIRSIVPKGSRGFLCAKIRNWGVLGTMMEECLGVPILGSYSRKGMYGLFRDYESVTLHKTGSGIPIFHRLMDVLPGYGYLFLTKAKKAE